MTKRFVYIRNDCYEFVEIWNHSRKMMGQKVWQRGEREGEYYLQLPCLIAKNQKYEDIKLFTFSYKAGEGFKWTGENRSRDGLSSEELNEIAELIILNEPEFFKVSRVKSDLLRYLFSKSS